MRYTEYMSIKKTSFIFLITLVSGLMVLSVVVWSWHHLASFSDGKYAENELIQWDVRWPLPDAQLDGLQAFIISASQPVHETVTVQWSVDGGIKSGVLAPAADQQQYSDIVDVTSWDWNSNGLYEVSIKVFSGHDELLTTQIIPVSVGGFGYFTIGGVTESLASTVELSDEVDITELEPVLAQSTTMTATPEVLGVQTFRVDWIPAPATQNQRFRLQVTGFASDEITAFWQSQGGHQNHVYANSAGEYEAVINVSGWRWRGQGPYPIIFSIVDQANSALLASETIELSWRGDPGTSELAIHSRGVEMKHVNPTDRQPASVAELNLVSNPSPASSVSQLTAAVGFTHSPLVRLWTAPKPAVTNSMVHQDERSRTALTHIVNQPNAVWLNGDGYDSPERIIAAFQAAAADNAVPTFVLYNIPHRDCGSHSSGGAATAAQYRSWINQLSQAMAGKRFVAIIEPDALAQLNCAPQAAQSERLDLLAYATDSLRSAAPQSYLYIDAGHPYWVTSTEMARRLIQAGVAFATGFSLNVSNFVSTEDNVSYGNHLSNLLGGKRYVIDTSRNGRGPAPDREWCNPADRALGAAPEFRPGSSSPLDGYLWIKFPGESDGHCGGGPRAGAWWPEYAVELFYHRPQS